MLEQLRQQLRVLEKPPGIADGLGVVRLGVAAVDEVLGGGLLRGVLHEVAAASEAHLPAATGFALGLSMSSCPALCRASTPFGNTLKQDVDGRDKPGHDGNGFVVWIAEDMALAESGAPYGPGLNAFGLAPERLLTVAVARPRDLPWAMEEALRCRAVRVVIGEWRHGAIGMVTQRRLSLAAAESGALALLLRASPANDASTAATRWIVGAAASVIPGREPEARLRASSTRYGERTRNPETNAEVASGFRARAFSASRNDEEIRSHFTVQLVRNRRGPIGSWILEWSDSDACFLPATPAQPVAAPAFDRPYRQIAREVA